MNKEIYVEFFVCHGNRRCRACVEKNINLRKRIWAREYRPRDLGQSSHAPCTSFCTLAAGCIQPVRPGHNPTVVVATTRARESKVESKLFARNKHVRYKSFPSKIIQSYERILRMLNDKKKKKVVYISENFVYSLQIPFCPQ